MFKKSWNHAKRIVYSVRILSRLYQKNTLRKHYLVKHVSDVLTYAYKIDPSEYIDTQPKEVINTEDTQQKKVANAEDDEMYTFTFSLNWKLLKRLTMLSIKEHITIEGLVSKFIIKGIGEKIVEESENE